MAEYSTRALIHTALRKHIEQQRKAKRPIDIFVLNSRGETPVEEALRLKREAQEAEIEALIHAAEIRNDWAEVRRLESELKGIRR